MIPAEAPHGAWRDEYDYVSFEWLDGLMTGAVDFAAPNKLGTYDFRIYDLSSGGGGLGSAGAAGGAGLPNAGTAGSPAAGNGGTAGVGG